MANNHRNVLPLIIGLGFFLLGNSHADKLILKDGSIEESDRIWESENYFHFILKGTRSVEVRYAKEIVLRIERNGDSSEDAQAAMISKPKPLAASVSTNTNVSASKEKQLKPSNISAKMQKEVLSPDQKFIEKNKGISFYDPHRTKRYWASFNSKHSTLTMAIAYLAKYYSRSEDWIEGHMGEENDLGVIHERLSRQLQAELNKDEKDVRAANQEKVETSIKSQNVETKKELLPSDLPPGDFSGIMFYDPRRAKKYWVSTNRKFNSLDQALASMAEQYGVAPDWIEDHMGETNNLDAIHNNIRKSLER